MMAIIDAINTIKVKRSTKKKLVFTEKREARFSTYCVRSCNRGFSDFLRSVATNEGYLLSAGLNILPGSLA